MICKICGSENDSSSKFCISCGSKLIKESTTVCPNGHIYSSSLSKCPYCPSPNLMMKAGIAGNMGMGQDTATMANKGDKTRIMGQEKGISNKTVIVGTGAESGQIKPGRKIIGWLISFTNNPNGDDFRLYEGRNLLSSSGECDIKISDSAVSSPHCMLLYRDGKIRIKDELSTNGTYLNGVSIDETEIKDGDVIKVGQTELKFRAV